MLRCAVQCCAVPCCKEYSEQGDPGTHFLKHFSGLAPAPENMI